VKKHKVISLIAILALLALDWAALHDIIKGEPNLTLEYSIIVLSILVILALIAIYVRNIKRSNPES
jgi:hypothetical protein